MRRRALVATLAGIRTTVIGDDSAFESNLVAEAGYTFEYTLEEPGTTLYCCFPHRQSDVKAVAVVE